MKDLDEETKKIILASQRNEVTEHFIYGRLSQSTKDPHNKEVLKRIAGEELEHYNFWKEYTNKDVAADKLKIWKYSYISRIFGITFGIKLMERGEEQAKITYENISKFVPDAKSILKDEDEHEKELIELIDEERLRYISSVVRGWNDALVSLLGALAGLTLVLQNSRIIAMAGLITGIAESLAISAAEYLSTKSEEGIQEPSKAAVYSGSAYLLTVLFLIFPYLLFTNFYFSLSFTILNALIVISIFSFYISVAKDISFRERFFEMTLISLGIAALTFGIGFLVRTLLHVEM
ncbi:MAG: VIT1/CCC1 transporter family protein [Euryarchaeota archaeon]|nr:VIT1/CCC1 transporter family protein [Euryarchaeota archaeon]